MGFSRCGSWSDSEIDVRVENEITGLAHYAVKAKDPEERLEGLDQNNMADMGETESMRQRQGEHSIQTGQLKGSPKQM